MASRAVLLDHLPLDRAAPTALHQQLYRLLRETILGGRLRPGSKLPPTRALARDLAIARNTVVTAYEMLLAEGYIESRSGTASRVAAALPDERPPVAPEPVAPAGRGGGLSRRGRSLRDLAGDEPRRPSLLVPGIPAVDLFPIETWRRLVSRAWRVEGERLLDHADPAGWMPLRRAIAEHVGAARGVSCEASQVIVVSSTRQAIQMVASLVADSGEAAWIEEPGYRGARASLAACGLEIAAVPVDEDGIDVAAGIRLAPDARLAYVSPSHQYPLGSTLSLARRLELLAWARRAGAIVIEDDYDGEFRFGGRPLAALYGLDGGERVVYVGTFSKIMFPALRLAYVVAPRGMVADLVALRGEADGAAPAEPQAALAEFISQGLLASHVRRMRGVYGARRQILLDLLRAVPALRPWPSQTGLHLAARLPDGTDDRDLARRLLDRGVGVEPLSRYFHGAPTASGFLLGYGATDEQGLVHAAQILRVALRAL